MEKEEKLRINSMCNSVIMVVNDYFSRVKKANDRSNLIFRDGEAFSNFQKLKNEAELLKKLIN